MPAQAVVLSHDTIVDFAKDMLQTNGVLCEWNHCEAVLNSWNQLQKHQHSHCKKSREGKFLCCLPKCLGREHHTEVDLRLHISLSHLSRVAIPCPVKGCQEESPRHSALINHFQNEHPHIIGMSITLPSKVLKPAWMPFAPVAPSIPPPLPARSINSAAIQTPLVTGSRRQRLQTPPAQRSPSQLPLSPKKPRMLHRMSDKDDDNEFETDIVIEDLDQSRDWAKNIEVRDWLVRKRPPETKQGTLSRPQMVFGGWKTDGPVPKSILYDAFALRVDELMEVDTLMPAVNGTS